MGTTSRPRIAILGRFATRTSATRHDGLVTALRLAQGVWAAGGDPVTLLPAATSNWAQRLSGFSAVLMPGGADVDPKNYGQTISSDEVYDVDPLQDEVDISLVRFAIDNAIPLLTICRGTQIANVALGGTLIQHMDQPHRHHVAKVTIDSQAAELGLLGAEVEASCYHHQVIDQLADGLEVIGRSAEGHIEAVRIESKAWAYGVQWHPEDNFDTEPNQLGIFSKFVSEAAKAGPLA